jgi:hypothetical protein
MMIRRAAELEDGEEKDNLVALLCNHMRKNYVAWNKDTLDDRKIADDLAELSGGKLHLTDELVRLMSDRSNQPGNRSKNNNSYQQNNGRSNGSAGNNNNNQRRRFAGNNQ